LCRANAKSNNPRSLAGLETSSILTLPCWPPQRPHPAFVPSPSGLPRRNGGLGGLPQETLPKPSAPAGLVPVERGIDPAVPRVRKSFAPPGQAQRGREVRGAWPVVRQSCVPLGQAQRGRCACRHFQPEDQQRPPLVPGERSSGNPRSLAGLETSSVLTSPCWSPQPARPHLRSVCPRERKKSAMRRVLLWAVPLPEPQTPNPQSQIRNPPPLAPSRPARTIGLQRVSFSPRIAHLYRGG
jgi:hypothetical protein